MKRGRGEQDHESIQTTIDISILSDDIASKKTPKILTVVKTELEDNVCISLFCL